MCAVAFPYRHLPNHTVRVAAKISVNALPITSGMQPALFAVQVCDRLARAWPALCPDMVVGREILPVSGRIPHSGAMSRLEKPAYLSG